MRRAAGRGILPSGLGLQGAGGELCQFSSTMAANSLVGLDPASLVQRPTHPSQFHALSTSSTPTVSLRTVPGLG
jgi:hypothetical protein